MLNLSLFCPFVSVLTGYGDPNALVPDRYKIQAVRSNQCKLLRTRAEIKTKYGIPSILPKDRKQRKPLMAYLEKLIKRNRAEVNKNIADKLSIIAPSLSTSFSTPRPSPHPPLSTELMNSPPKKVVRKRKCADSYIQEGNDQNAIGSEGGGKRRRVSRGVEINMKVHPDDAHLFYF